MISQMLSISKMRLPTCDEWDQLAFDMNEENNLLHWNKMYFWCKDECPFERYRKRTHGTFGFKSAICLDFTISQVRDDAAGFRPAFEIRGAEALPNGTIVPVGSLCMGGELVKVPKNPTCDGDVPDYIPGSKLELWTTALPSFCQVRAIKIGGVFISDRVLLKNISCENLHEQGFC